MKKIPKRLPLLENLDNEFSPNFLNDPDKMKDFKEMDKESFMKSYSYLTDKEYENTKALAAKTNEGKSDDSFKIVVDFDKKTVTVVSSGMEDKVITFQDMADEMEDAWYGFEKNGKEFDVNVFIDLDADTKVMASVYGVSDEGQIDTSDQYDTSVEVIGSVEDYMK